MNPSKKITDRVYCGYYLTLPDYTNGVFETKVKIKWLDRDTDNYCYENWSTEGFNTYVKPLYCPSLNDL